MNLSVKEQPLGDVLKTLQIMTGFNLMIDPRSEAAVKDNPITALELRDAQLMTALAMLAAAAGEGFVWIGNGSNIAVLTHREHVGSYPTTDK